MNNSNKLFVLFPIGVLVLFGFSCQGTNEERALEDNLAARLNTLFLTEAEESRFSGTVTVGNRDSVIFNNAWGIADRTFNIPMDTDFRFDIASVNKSMVGALVMIAENEQKLSTNDHLVDLLANFKYSGSFNESITIHHLLTHTSGLPDYDGVDYDLAANNFRFFKRLHFARDQYVDFISQLDPIAAPGMEFHYSNFAYHLLCIILEESYDMTFGDLLRLKITDPLEMKNTYSTTDNQQVSENLVSAYNFIDGEWRENGFIDLTIGRRVFSTSEDLYKWANAMSDTTFLPQLSLDQIKINHLKSLSNNYSYGYGWVIYGRGDSFGMGELPVDLPYIIHGGSTEGFKSILVNVNDGDWIISLLANSGNRANEMELARAVTKILKTHNLKD